MIKDLERDTAYCTCIEHRQPETFAQASDTGLIKNLDGATAYCTCNALITVCSKKVD